MGKRWNGKLLAAVSLLTWVVVVRVLTGCSVEKESREKVRDLESTVVGEADLPAELRTLIEEKKTAPFKLTYNNDQGMFIVVGYGEQPTGGYSITLEELYLTDNAVVIDTELHGPDNNEPTGVEKSYPYLTVRTEIREEPVIFQ